MSPTGSASLAHTDWLDVGDDQRMAVHHRGRHWRDGGMPLLVLHGGPGSSQSPALWAAVDLDRFHVIAPDQRGCGASTPAGTVHANTLPHLLADLRGLRAHLAEQGCPPWLVLGGSWGATLAIAHAADAPEAVAGLVLRATFGGRIEDLRAFFEADAGRPGEAAALERLKRAAGLPPGADADALLAALPVALGVEQGHGQALPPGPAEGCAEADAQAWAVVDAWAAWESVRARPAAAATGPAPSTGEAASGPATSTTAAVPGSPPQGPSSGFTPRQALHRYRIQSAYLARTCDLSPPLLTRAAQLPAMPVAMLHAADDRVCPPAPALALAQAMPAACRVQWQLLPQGGHQPMDPSLLAALRRVLRRWAEQGDLDLQADLPDLPGQPVAGRPPQQQP